MIDRPIHTVSLLASMAAGFLPSSTAFAEVDDEARRLFKSNCVLCHGADGRARTPIARTLGVKDLTVSTASEAEIQKQITEGTKGPDGRERMPSFGKKLNREQIQSLIPLVKDFRK